MRKYLNKINKISYNNKYVDDISILFLLNNYY
jgi:hypothetical protein